MFVCTLFEKLRSQGTTDSFYTLKKSLLKSFDHPRHLISRVPPLGAFMLVWPAAEAHYHA